ncbi:MAG: PD-(D/E)XK nuclease family transposase [Synergistaceae bacterium]|nr:PD-(D/E)XK nuclease family transposase [Synergistaceae bacterium]
MKPDKEKMIDEATLMADEFFCICMNGNITAVQKVIRTILGRDDLEITSVETQREFRGFKRSLRLDVYAKDRDGIIYNLEVRVRNEGAEPKRSRFHCSMIDVQNLEKSQDFDKLPESYVIFITMNDVLGYGRIVYTVSRYIDGLNERFDDEQHIVYVNCAAEDDGSELAKLIHDMKCSKAEEMLIPELAEIVGHYKNTQKGRHEMSELFEKYYGEELAAGIAEAERKAKREKEGFVTNIIKSGAMTLDKIAEAFSMSLAEVEALAGKVSA